MIKQIINMQLFTLKQTVGARKIGRNYICGDEHGA